MSQIPLNYYIDWHGLEDFKAYVFDEDGIPRVKYNKRIGTRYNAITIAQYGLYLLDRWQGEHRSEWLDQARKCARWLIREARAWKDGLAWIYDFDLPFYGRRGPWISAMAQGEAISLLLRLHTIHPEQAYAETAQKAFRLFLMPDVDGVCDTLDDGAVVFEEYPTQPPSHVLNGHVFALFGVYDFARFFDDHQAEQLLEAGLATLEKHWSLWDTGYWTRYDLFPIVRLASPMYHELHVRQMRALAGMFEKDIFHTVARRWQSMAKSPVCRLRWFSHKFLEKLRPGRGL